MSGGKIDGRKIFCFQCNKILGYVRDAKLHKEINYVCDQCRKTLEAAKKYADLLNNQRKAGGKPGNIFEDIFKDNPFGFPDPFGGKNPEK